MSYEDSPSLDQFREGLPEKPPKSYSPARRLRVIILLLAVVVVGLGGFSLFQTNQAALVRGEGTVTGIVVNELNQPIEAQVFISGTDLTTMSGPDGKFEIRNAPAGTQKITAAYRYMGWEYPIEIKAGSSTDAGTLQVDSTVRPYMD